MSRRACWVWLPLAGLLLFAVFGPGGGVLVAHRRQERGIALAADRTGPGGSTVEGPLPADGGDAGDGDAGDGDAGDGDAGEGEMDPGSAVSRVDGMDGAGADGSRYGVAVLDRDTGGLSLGKEGSTPFYAASVVKLFTIVDILHRVEAGTATLTDAQRTDIQRALEVSDDQAMDALWSGFGGPATVSGMISLAGLHNTTPPSVAGQWGETRTSAADVVKVYDYLLRSLNASDADLVVDDLSNAGDTGADGFDQAFGLLGNPRPADAAAKQGWMSYARDLYLHSTGLAGSGHRYVIAVLSKQPGSAGWAGARQRMDTAVGHLTAALALTS